jgi:hypothetical protein
LDSLDSKTSVARQRPSSPSLSPPYLVPLCCMEMSSSKSIESPSSDVLSPWEGGSKDESKEDESDVHDRHSNQSDEVLKLRVQLEEVHRILLQKDQTIDDLLEEEEKLQERLSWEESVRFSLTNWSGKALLSTDQVLNSIDIVEHSHSPRVQTSPETETKSVGRLDRDHGTMQIDEAWCGIDAPSVMEGMQHWYAKMTDLWRRKMQAVEETNECLIQRIERIRREFIPRATVHDIEFENDDLRRQNSDILGDCSALVLEIESCKLDAAEDKRALAKTLSENQLLRGEVLELRKTIRDLESKE